MATRSFSCLHPRAWLGTATALLLLSCGGNTFTSTDDGAAGSTATGGSSGESGSSGNGSGDGGAFGGGGSSSGGSSGGGGASSGGSPGSGGTSSGGSSGSGGVAGSGGGGGGECKYDEDCPQPGAPCSAAFCINGSCIVEFTDGCGTGGAPGTSCTTASECPAPPPACNSWPDGSYVCPGVDCVSGQCVMTNTTCPPSTASCPDDVPAHGSACSTPVVARLIALPSDTAHCTYGDDPRTECRTQALCSAGSWVVTNPTASHCSDSPLPSGCPSSPPSGDCSIDGPSCWYGSGANCSCSSCLGGSEYPVCEYIDPPQWHCQAPPSGCPTSAPQAGSACSSEGLSCGTSCDLQIVCQGGLWRWQQGFCPICAAPDTPIGTPTGDRSISELRVGDLVYSVHDGAIVAVPVLRAESTPVQNHQVMRVHLEGGAVLEISPGHPTADGRTFADLTAGGTLDAQHSIAQVELVPYPHDRTYDILPDSDSGTYFAAGAMVGSTLFVGASGK